jgi:hypothetical protein
MFFRNFLYIKNYHPWRDSTSRPVNYNLFGGRPKNRFWANFRIIRYTCKTDGLPITKLHVTDMQHACTCAVALRGIYLHEATVSRVASCRIQIRSIPICVHTGCRAVSRDTERHENHCSCKYQGCQMVCFQTKNTNLEGLATEVVGIFYGHLVYFTAPLVYFVTFWYILWLFGVFFPFLVCCTKKNLATLVNTHQIFRCLHQSQPVYVH